MRRLRSGVVLGALLIVAGCSSSSGSDAGVGGDAGADAGTDAGSPDGGAITCADYGFVASGTSCGASCGSVSCACPSGSPRSLSVCTQDGCIAAMDCDAVCAAPSLGDALACTDTHAVRDAGTDAGISCFTLANQTDGPAQISLLAMDVDGTGRVDLAGVTAGFWSRYVLEADGGMTKTQTPTAGVGSMNPVPADFTGDGLADLFSNDWAQLTVGWNGGDGGIRPGVVMYGGFVPMAAALGDFNHDGTLDIANVADAGSGNNGVVIAWNQGDGGFAPGAPLLVTPSLAALGAADFNHDGWMDLLLTSTDPMTQGYKLQVLINQRDGGFAESGRFPSTYSELSGYLVADFNRDGKLDLVADGLVRDGDGDGGFSSGPSVGGHGGRRAVDLDGDGFPDLINDNVSAQGSVDVLWNHGDAGFTGGHFQALDGYAFSMALGDFDGDGRVDVAVQGYGPGQLRVFANHCGAGGPSTCSPTGSPCQASYECCAGTCWSGSCL